MDDSHPIPDDPEVVEFIERTLAFYPADSYAKSIEENRALYDAYAEAFREPRPEGVGAEDFAIPAEGPSRNIPCRRYLTPGADRAGPMVMYVHGGGFILGGLESHDDACSGIAEQTGLEVVAVDYRLAPEAKHPSQLDDVDAAFLALAASGRKIVAAGDSGGAALIAALLMRRKARGGAMPDGQVMIYGGFGGDRTKGSYIENANAPLLKTKEGDTYANARIEPGQDLAALRRDPEFSPLSATDFAGLPQAFVVAADIDPIRDDSFDWAARLKAAGVPVELRNEPHLVHGYLRARHMSKRAADSFAAICEAISRMAQGRFAS